MKNLRFLIIICNKIDSLLTTAVFGWFKACLINYKNKHTTCADYYSLDQFPCVETGLDDIGAAEECVPLMLLCVVETVSLIFPFFM